MQKELPLAEQYAKRNRRQSIWRKIVRVMACVVVFCTTYALILPAITMERSPCALEEHTHSDECYTQQTVQQITHLGCSYESLGVHRHTQECRNADNELVCGFADFLVHIHGASCFDSQGNFVCRIPEIREHEHSDACYAPVETEAAVHTHDESCYAAVRGDLICEKEEIEGHAHTEDCYTQGDLVCGLEESEGHTHGEQCAETVLVCELTVEPHVHGDGCWTQLVCELPEDENHTHSDECSGLILSCDLTEQPHVHGDGCYQTNSLCDLSESEGHRHDTSCYEALLSCDKEEIEGHAHDDSCYEQAEELICGIEEEVPEEEPVPAEEAEPELICEEEEVKLHTHDENTCYEVYVDGNGETQKRLICPEVEVRAHVHSDDCFVTEEVPADTESLTCTVPEAHVHGEGCYDEAGELTCTEPTEGHTHTERCYGTWILSCGKEEHTHNAECTPILGLSEEERAAVAEVEALIEPLPTYDDMMAKLDEFYEANDTEGEEDYMMEVYAQVEEAYRAYMTLPEEHREYVSNADKLMELEFIIEEPESKTLTVEGADYIVTVTFDAKAAIPEDAELCVTEILENEAALGYYEGTRTALSEKEQEEIFLSKARFFDISIRHEGEEIVPPEGINFVVNITFAKGMDVADNEVVNVVHFKEDGNVEVVDSISSDDTCCCELHSPEEEDGTVVEYVEFVTDGFSVYAVATTESRAGVYVMDADAFNDGDAHVRFYWRFREEGASGNLTSNKTADGRDIVTVTYNGGSVLPYITYKNSITSGGYNSMVNPKSGFFKSGEATVNIQTIEGYVVTGYSINCEWGVSDASGSVGKDPTGGPPSNKGENCATAKALDIPVSVDTTGLYRSDFDLTGYLGRTGKITADDFGHSSWVFANLAHQYGYMMDDYKQYRYVLLIEVAPVNLDIEITKKADRESVVAGGSIAYTAVATFPEEKASANVNYMRNVVFTDSFITSATQVKSVKYTSPSGITTTLTSRASKDTSSSNTSPSNYYVAASENKIYINSYGRWEKDGYFTIEYTYTTDPKSPTKTLTNTIWAVGTYDTTSRQAYAIATVNVIVNSANQGSIRIYKKFDGLTQSEVSSMLTKSIDPYVLRVEQNGAPIAVKIKNKNNELVEVSELTFSNNGIKYYSGSNGVIVYYADILGLDPGSNYSIVESNYLYGDYTWSGSYSTSGNATIALNDGRTGNLTVSKGTTTFVNVTNKYFNDIDIVIQKVDDANRPLGGATFRLQYLDGSTWKDIESQFTINLENGEARYTIAELTAGTYRLSEISAPAGYLVLAEPIEFIIDGGKATLTKQNNAVVLSTDQNGLPVFTVENHSGYELPETGGAGTYLYTMGGLLALMTAAVLLYIQTSKRRKEELTSF